VVTVYYGKRKLMMRAVWLGVALAFCGGGTAMAAQEPAVEKPLPEIGALMGQVLRNEQKSEVVERDYIYREHTKIDKLGSNNAVTDTRTEDHEVFCLNNIQIERLVARDGHALSAEEAKQENARIDNDVKRAAKHQATAAGNPELTIDRILELGKFSNERRQRVNGTDFIIVDYTGNRTEKAHNEIEVMFREMQATFYIHEQDAAIERLSALFDHDFKFGVAVRVSKGTKINIGYQKVNNEIWLPYIFDVYGHLRFLLFFGLNGHMQMVFSGFRKFHATATVLPNFTTVEPAAESTAPKPAPHQNDR
jgi:hypothetical protein